MIARKKLFNLLRILVSVGLIAFVCTKIQLDDTTVLDPSGEEITQRGVISVLRGIDLAWFIPTFLLAGVAPTVGSVRFRLLLMVQGVTITGRRALSLTFLGHFFNNFMLGLTGGDVVKAYYVARETHRKTEAVVTVFLDRIVGLIALAMLAAVMVLLNLREDTFREAAVYVWMFLIMACFMVLMLYSRRLRRKVHVVIAVTALVGGGLLIGSRIVMRGWDAVWYEAVIFLAVMPVVGAVAAFRPLRQLLQMHKVRMWMARSRIVREMDQAFNVFSRKPATTVAAFAISIFCHGVTLTAVYGFARALGIDDVPFRYFLVFVPVINMITALPISLGGWGMQEGVYVMFFAAVGVSVSEAFMLSLVYRVCAAILWSLPGGVVLLMRKDRATVEEVARAMTDDEESFA